MHRFFRGFCTIFLFLFVFLSWILLWAIQTLLINLMLRPFITLDQRKDFCGHVFHGMNYVVAVLLNPMWRVKQLNKQPSLPKNTKVIFMMNHRSNADSWICVGSLRPRDCKWVSKGELENVWFGGWALSNSGDLFVHFTKEKGGWGTNAEEIQKVMETARGYLSRYQPLAIFPEGVRNRSSRVEKLRMGFINLALEEGATVIPLGISGTEKAWPVSSWMFDCADIYVSFGEPIVAEKMTSTQLSEKIKESLNEQLDRQEKLQMKRKE